MVHLVGGVQTGVQYIELQLRQTMGKGTRKIVAHYLTYNCILIVCIHVCVCVYGCLRMCLCVCVCVRAYGCLRMYVCVCFNGCVFWFL